MLTLTNNAADPEPSAAAPPGNTWLGGAGLAAGALALGLATGALLRTRRKDPKA